MTKTRTLAQWATYTAIAVSALAACAIVGVGEPSSSSGDSVPTASPTAAHSIHLPNSVIAEIRASNADATLAPCTTEDSDNCYWDASTMGNSKGNSFIAWNGNHYYGERK